MYKHILWTLCLIAPSTLSAENISYTGTLATSESTFETTFNVGATGPVTIQTWGFGGGINAAGSGISAGGFDPLVTLFSGTSPNAAIVTDSSGNPLADGDVLSNPPWSYVGNCPPAGARDIGSTTDCGDVFMKATLSPGSYTLVLSDAAYLPFAIFDDGELSEGFVDFTPGVFQTCDPNSDACITTNGNYAVDILGVQDETSGPSATPDPSTLTLFGTGLAALAGVRRRVNQRNRT